MISAAVHSAIWSPKMTAENVGRVLDKAGEIGYDFVNLPMRQPGELEPAKLAQEVLASGIGAVCTAGMCPGGDIGSSNYEAREVGRAHLALVISCARDIGIRQINGPLYGPHGQPGEPVSPDGFRRSAENLADMADLAASSGITLCIEVLNRYETSLLNTVTQGLEYIDLVNRPNIKLHIDTFHMSIEERDAANSAANALPRLGYFELDQSHRGYIDEGNLDLMKIAAPLAKGGYKGLVGVEAFSRSRLPDSHANALSIWRDHYEDADQLARDALAAIKRMFPEDNEPTT